MRLPVVHRLYGFPLSIPLRRTVTHATSARQTAEPVIVAVEFTDGTMGFGETLPRPYVTNETVASVVDALSQVFAPALMGFHPETFPEALEFIEALPWSDGKDRPIPAARAAVELALLDAVLQCFDRDADAVVRWMGLPGFGSPGSIKQIRFSGVLPGDDLDKTASLLRKMYWGGLRDFKLKVGVSKDRERTELVAAYLAGPIERGRASLRIDANGYWSKDEAIEWLDGVKHLPIAAVEQPLPRGCEEELVVLRDLFDIPLTHDESLITIEDARKLVDLKIADVFNIRLSKCGGFIPALRLAGFLRRHGGRIQLGCMVGETSILSAAGLRFLEVCPGVAWAEGCFGRFLLSTDVSKKSLSFGYGGRPPRVPGQRLCGNVDMKRLEELCEDRGFVINL